MSLFHVPWPNSVQLYSICILLMSSLIDHTREESKVKGAGSIRQVARKQLESRHSSGNRVVIYADFDNSYYCGIYAIIWKTTWTSNSTCSQDYCLEKTLFFSRRLRNVEGIPFKQWTPEWLFFASSIFDQTLLILISVCWSLSPQPLGENQECTLQRSPVHSLTCSPASA